MRDANGREIYIGDTVRIRQQRMWEQPIGIVTEFQNECVYMRSSDGIVRGMFPENLTIWDDDLTMDEGL